MRLGGRVDDVFHTSCFLRAGIVHLQEIVRRIKTPEEAAAAIDAAQKFALHRARRAQHSAMSPELSAWILRVRQHTLPASMCCACKDAWHAQVLTACIACTCGPLD